MNGKPGQQTSTGLFLSYTLEPNLCSSRYDFMRTSAVVSTRLVATPPHCNEQLLIHLIHPSHGREDAKVVSPVAYRSTL